MVDCTVSIITSGRKETESIKKTKKTIKSKEKEKDYSGTICRKQVINIKK